MTVKLFVALYLILIVGVFVFAFVNFPVFGIFFVFLFIAVFGGIFVARGDVIAAGFLLVSLVVLGIGVFGMYQSLRANDWPTAWGAITRAWTSCAESSGFGPCIEYTYSVNGRTFSDSSVRSGEFQYQVWYTIPDKFERGHEVQVRYDPATPSTSRLTTDISPRDWITAAVGGIMALLSVAALVQVIRTRAQSPVVATRRVNELEPLSSPSETAIAQADAVIPDLASQLEKLAELHDNDKITDEEYEQAKRRLLGMPQERGGMSDSAPAMFVDVVLLDVGKKKTDVVLALREITAKESVINLIDLATAKRLIDNTPSVVAPNVPAEVGQRVKARLEKAGATVELKPC